MMKTFLENFKNLELNKGTADVDMDVRQLNILNKARYFGFYFVILTVSFSTYFYVLNSIKSDEFRKALIEEANIAPAFAFFYDDYADELEHLNKARSEKAAELQSIAHTASAPRSSRDYRYKDFIEDLKANKVSMDLDERIKKMKIYEEYTSVFFITKILQDSNQTVEINGNTYDYKTLGVKVNKFQKTEALEKLETPAILILEKMNLNTQNREYVDAVKNSIYRISRMRYNDRMFFQSLKDVELKNAVPEIKKSIFSGESKFAFNGRSMSYKYRLDRLDKEFEAHKKVRVAEQKKAYEKYLENKEATDKQIEKIKQELVVIDAGIVLLKKMRSDVKNRDQHEEQIESFLDKTKGMTQWKM